MIQSIIAAFQSQGWAFDRVEEQDVVEAAFDAHHTRVPLHVQAFPGINAISVVSRSTLTTPPTHLFPVSELLWRTNKTLTIGNFELDPDHGTSLFRTTNIFTPGKPDQSIITALVHAAIAEMDRLTPYLAIVLRTAPADLRDLSIPDLLLDEALIPPPPENTNG